MKSLFGLVTLVLGYFSIVSTITVSRVAAIERSVNHREEQVRSNERNIAVLLEKVTTVERMVRELREAVAMPDLGRSDSAQRGPPRGPSSEKDSPIS